MHFLLAKWANIWFSAFGCLGNTAEFIRNILSIRCNKSKQKIMVSGHQDVGLDAQDKPSPQSTASQVLSSHSPNHQEEEWKSEVSSLLH